MGRAACDAGPPLVLQERGVPGGAHRVDTVNENRCE